MNGGSPVIDKIGFKSIYYRQNNGKSFIENNKASNKDSLNRLLPKVHCWQNY